MPLRLLLTLSGGLEIVAGWAALIIAAPVVSLLLGGLVGQIGPVLGRPFAAGVSSSGVACLKAGNDVASPAGLAVSLGITAYNLLAALVLFWAAAEMGLGGPLLWGAGIGHGVLGALFVLALIRL